MSDLEHARLLLLMAEKDLKAIRGMTDPEAFDDEIFGFHAQQAAEKALKAWLALLRVAYPRTHDLEELAALLKANQVLVPETFSELADLADFAVQYRYELAENLSEPLDRSSLTTLISKLVEQVKALVAQAP